MAAAVEAAYPSTAWASPGMITLSQSALDAFGRDALSRREGLLLALALTLSLPHNPVPGARCCYWRHSRARALGSAISMAISAVTSIISVWVISAVVVVAQAEGRRRRMKRMRMVLHQSRQLLSRLHLPARPQLPARPRRRRACSACGFRFQHPFQPLLSRRPCRRPCHYHCLRVA